MSRELIRFLNLSSYLFRINFNKSNRKLKLFVPPPLPALLRSLLLFVTATLRCFLINILIVLITRRVLGGGVAQKFLPIIKRVSLSPVHLRIKFIPTLSGWVVNFNSNGDCWEAD